jgi:hypothetical protein
LIPLQLLLCLSFARWVFKMPLVYVPNRLFVHSIQFLITQSCEREKYSWIEMTPYNLILRLETSKLSNFGVSFVVLDELYWGNVSTR